jgi:hypothetical protein
MRPFPGAGSSKSSTYERRQECLLFQPQYADLGDHIVLKGSWTKGGRPRTVLIRTSEQRTVLEMHGLRHLYAQVRYEVLTGWKAPATGGPVARLLRGGEPASESVSFPPHLLDELGNVATYVEDEQRRDESNDEQTSPADLIELVRLI